MSVALVLRGDDLAPFAAIHAQCFPDAWSEIALDQLLATQGTFLLGHATGFVLARVAAGEAEILTLAVAPRARRRGTATALVEAAAAHAYGLGATEVFLEVAADNLPARTLYGRLGFAEAGLRKGYYSAGRDTPADALILRKALSPLGKSPSPR